MNFYFVRSFQASKLFLTYLFCSIKGFYIIKFHLLIYEQNRVEQNSRVGLLGRFLNRSGFDTERLGLLVSVATLKQNRVWSEQLGLCSLVLVTEQHNLLGFGDTVVF